MTNAGMNCFDDELEWPAMLDDQGVIIDAVNGIESDFDNNLAARAELAARLIAVLELVAAGDCLGCRNVACRISMLVEDLEVEAAHR